MPRFPGSTRHECLLFLKLEEKQNFFFFKDQSTCVCFMICRTNTCLCCEYDSIQAHGCPKPLIHVLCLREKCAEL